MAGFWKKITSLVTGPSATPAVVSAPQPSEKDKADDALWQEVYSAREAYYAQEIGPFPEDILKIGHMFGVWPGGGLYVIPADKLRAGAWAYTTFGFTNSDMPTGTSVSEVAVQRDDLGRVTNTAGTLKAKNRATAAQGAAGYGYEFLVIAGENAEWPLWLLQWAANAEILNDAGLLERVNKYAGLTVQELEIGKAEPVNVLISKARAPLPIGTTLPNGKMELLIATVITDAEMQWSMTNGRDALLDKLMAAGIGQFSSLGRESVVA
jgi:hypothetical protein